MRISLRFELYIVRRSLYNVASQFGPQNMLTITQTIDSIFKRLVRRTTLTNSIYIAARGSNFAVFAVNCFHGSEQKVLGKYVIATIRSMNLHNKPKRLGFSTTFIKPKDHEAIICSPCEVLISLYWD